MPYSEIGGGRIYWEKRGWGHDFPVVAFLHDGLGSVRSWKDLPEKICSPRHWPAFLYDRSGYGRSSADIAFSPGYLEREACAFGRVLDHFGLEAVHLLGHSDGASIALIFAARCPARVISLVLVAPHTFVEEEARAGIRELLCKARAEEPRWLRKQHGEQGRQLLEAWAQAWLSEEHSGWDIRPGLRRIECPVLVVQGDQDEFATMAQVDAVREAIPKSQTWVVPGCGHKPHMDEKESFAGRVAEFIESVNSNRIGGSDKS